MSAEIRAWFQSYQQQLRAEERDAGRQEGYQEGYQEGRKDGERNLLLRLLRARFGELPAAAVARIEAAETAEIERWGVQALGAQRVADVLGELS